MVDIRAMARFRFGVAVFLAGLGIQCFVGTHASAVNLPALDGPTVQQGYTPKVNGG